MPLRKVGPKCYADGATIRQELEHLDRVAEIEVEDLIRVEDVHLAEGAGLEEVVDSSPLMTSAAWELNFSRGGVGSAEGAALDGVRLEAED